MVMLSSLEREKRKEEEEEETALVKAGSHLPTTGGSSKGRSLHEKMSLPEVNTAAAGRPPPRPNLSVPQQAVPFQTRLPSPLDFHARKHEQ